MIFLYLSRCLFRFILSFGFIKFKTFLKWRWKTETRPAELFSLTLSRCSKVIGREKATYRPDIIHAAGSERPIQTLIVFPINKIQINEYRKRKFFYFKHTYLQVVRPHERENGGDAAVRDRAEHQRQDDGQRYVALGILRFLT